MSDAGEAITFRTGRLDVRPLTNQDLKAFHTVWGDPNVIFWAASADLASTRQRLDRLIHRALEGVDESGWFAVLSRAERSFVGDVVLESASWSRDLAEIGWHTARSHQRKGYATEAASGLLQHARRLGVEQVWAKILPDNRASRKVATRIGMRRVGTVEHAGITHDLWRVDTA